MLRDQNNVQVTAGEQGSEVKNKHTSTWRGGGGVITVNNMTEGGGRLHSRVGPSSTRVRGAATADPSSSDCTGSRAAGQFS